MSIVSAAVILFLVMDPLGNVPVFLAILRHVPENRRRIVLLRELFVAYVILMLFLWGGEPALNLLSLREESISIAGGIVLFLISLRMIFPPEKGVMGELPEGEPFVFPLAVPLVAGPSTLATLLLLVRAHPGQDLDLWLALTGAWLAAAAILASSTAILRVAGKRGLIAIERLMGMVLVLVAVQMTLDGIKAFLG